MNMASSKLIGPHRQMGRGAGDIEHGAEGLERGEGDLEREAGDLGRGVGEEEGTTRTWMMASGRKSPMAFPMLRKWSTTAVDIDGEAVRRGDGLAGEQEDVALGEGDGSLSAKLRLGRGVSLCELAVLMLILGMCADQGTRVNGFWSSVLI